MRSGTGDAGDGGRNSTTQILSGGERQQHSRHFEALLGNPLCSDVLLVTSDGERIHGHKAMLVAVSPTFRAMFGSSCHTESAASEVAVPYRSEPFRVALRFIYTGSTSGFEDALELLDLSTYYCLEELRDAAVGVLKQRTTAENTFSMLEIALRFHSAVLRDHCVTMVRQHNTEVLHRDEWLRLSLDAALLLVQEAVIEGELCVLQKCVDWCRSNAPTPASSSTTTVTASDPGGNDKRDDQGSRPPTPTAFHHSALLQFLQFIDFTRMTEAEVDAVEAMQCVPLDVLYRSFKNHCLGLPAAHTPRKGGIILQWELGTSPDLCWNDNHVHKVSADFLPRTVYAINRFTRGRHYFTFLIEDFRSPHDCLVGVSVRGTQKDYHFEPCCSTVCAPPGTIVSAAAGPGTPLLQDHRCVIGVLVDFRSNCIQWFNHLTKQLLFTAQPSGDGADGQVALESPLVPSATLYHKSNGGVVLAESTSFLDDRSIHVGCGMTMLPTPRSGGANKSAALSPIKSPFLRRQQQQQQQQHMRPT